ncbi:AraC family transcriptional regulator [Terriglobus albidus]|uniref:AraC family transcriptional regulator n=1 Tax=Terriglobus albidus TaxID=1592106 RepID=A0A5B9E4M5_9BACT|nr:AraC family transcriptional regulator [Terriglobus albidus]QEE27253.1 AraC family transcriptional regulator [Terriglobus albidus]
MDPFLDLIQLLRPRVMLTAGIYASGQWAVSFPMRNDVLFCWVELGECQLFREGAAPLPLRPGDFVLIRTSASFTLGTDPALRPEDSESLVAASNDPVLRLGDGTGTPAVLKGGRFVFDTTNEELLTGLLPALIRVSADDTSSWRLRAFLSLNETESKDHGPGSDFISTRLLEIILVEILRHESHRVDRDHTSLLAGLSDPIAARALAAMHSQVAQKWTVARLARLCGVSRSTFATHFQRIVGVGPIDYLQRWRIALAKDALCRGQQTIGEVAVSIGFKSSSAFSTAFSKAVGCSPRMYLSRANPA